MSLESTSQIETKIKELENVKRLIGNTLSLINEMEVKGAYAAPVAEIQGWLTGFNTSIVSQIDTLRSTLPVEAPKVIEAELVK